MSVQTFCGCGRRAVLKFSRSQGVAYRTLYAPVDKSTRQKRLLPRNLENRTVASVIYADPYDSSNVAVLEVDLDLKSRFSDLKKLHKNVTLRKLDEINVYQMAMKHKNLKEVASKKQQLEERREEISREINHLRKQEQTEARKYIQKKLKQEGKEVRDDLKKVTRYFVEMEYDVLSLGLELPVDILSHTPEEDDRIERSDKGLDPELRCEAENHITLGERQGTIVKRNVGPMRYYLAGDLAHREQDIVYNVTESLSNAGFVQMTCPNIVKTLPVEASGNCIEMPSKVYLLKDKDIAGSNIAERTCNKTRYLAGVAPQGFIAFMTKMNFQESTLPLRYFSIGKNYSPSRGVQDRGLFTTPEANVVELFGIAKDSHQMETLYSQYQDVMWDMCQQICPELPKRLVAKVPKSLALTEAGRVDLEVWSPYLNEYVVIGSVAAWSDFLARRVMSKWSPYVDKVIPGNHVLTVHATALNVTAMIGLLVEAESARRK